MVNDCINDCIFYSGLSEQIIGIIKTKDLAYTHIIMHHHMDDHDLKQLNTLRGCPLITLA